MADLAVAIQLLGEDRASGPIGNVGKSLGSLEGIGKLAAGALVGVGVAATGVGVASVKMAGTFEKGMLEVATLTPDVAESLQDISQDVLDLSARLGTDAVGATKALYQAISAGVPANNALSFLEIASKAAIGGVTDTTTAVDGISSAVNAFRAQGLDAGRAADIMFATVRAGKTDFGQLSGALSNVAPLASTMGVSFEEVAAAMATLTLSGTQTSVASTQVRAALQALARPTAALTSIFNDAGFASGEAAIAQVGFAKAAEIVTEATGGSVAALTPLLGSVEAVQAVLGVTGDQAETFAGVMEGVANSAGAADEAFDTMSAGFEQNWKVLQSSLNRMMIMLGQELLPSVIPVVKAFSEMLPAAFDVARGAIVPLFRFVSTDVLPALGGIAKVVQADVVPAFQTIASFVQRNIVPVLSTVAAVIATVVVPAFAAWSGAAIASASATIIALAPVLIPIAAIGAAVFLLSKAWTENWGGIQEKTEAVWGFLSTHVFEPLSEELDRFKVAVLPQLAAAWESMTETAQNAWQALQDFLEPAITAFGRFWESHHNTIGRVLKVAWDLMTLGVRVAWDLIQGLIFAGLKVLQGDWAGAWNEIRENFRAAWDKIVATLGDALALVWDAITTTWENVRGFVSTMLQEILERLVSWGHEAWDVMRDAGIRMVEGIKSGLAGMWDAIVSPVQNAIKAAQDALSNFKPNVGGIIQSAGAAASNAVSTAFDWGAYNFARNMGATEEEANLRATGRGAGAPILGGDAAQQGEGAIAWAMQNVGAQAWNWLCQKFVENAFGTAGRYPSAKAAADALQTNRGGTPARGSLVFFKPDPTNANFGHVGIALGGNQFVSATANGVKVDSLTDSYWGRLYTGFGLPRFATGGSFLVPGAGGTDSQLVQFMATPKEIVTVETPGQYSNKGTDAQTIARAVAMALDGMRVSLDRQSGEEFVVFHWGNAQRRGRV